MAVIYIPRVLGGTIIYTIPAPQSGATPVSAIARDGKVTAIARDGVVTGKSH